jgi:RNA polymerase sigma-70 factor (ECF subfamily)
MTPDPTRPSLLSRVRSTGDQAAWAEFEAQYRDLLLRYGRRCGLSLADAEDVCQIVLLRLVRALPNFRYDPAVGRFHDWLYRITRNAIIDFRACPNPARLSVVDDSHVAQTDGDGPTDPHWEQEWLDHHLRLALATLRATCEQRSIAAFERVMAGAALEQVAAEFGMGYDAVQKTVRRMRTRLEERIAEQIRAEEAPNA